MIASRARRSAPLVLTLPLALLFGSGCAVDQKKDIAAYRGVLDGAQPASFDYHAGQPLTLSAAMLLANRYDEQLASSGEDYVQALADRQRQFATFLPNISLAPTYSWLNSRGSSSVVTTGAGGGGTTVTGVGGSNKQGQADVPIVANYTVFNGLADVANYRRAGYTTQQREALLRDLQQTTLLNVASAYYTVLVNERSVKVLLNSVSVQDARVQDMQGRERAGIARPLDVAQTQAQDAATRVQLIQAQNNVRNGRLALAFLTASAVQDAPLADELRVPQELPSADDALAAAEKHRQDVQASEAAVEASRQSVQSAIAEYYPSVTLDIDYFLHKESLSRLTVWDGIVQADIPIFRGGIIEADVRTAWSQLRQAWLNQQRTRRQVAEQVRQSYENVRGSKSRVAELRVEVAAARDALQQAQFSYQAGLATNLDVLTATDQLLSAQLSLATEALNYKVYFLQLQRAEGLLEIPGKTPSTAPAAIQPDEAEITTPALNTGAARPPAAPSR